MKKSILLWAQGDKGWIGGLYYVKNVAFQLAQNEYIKCNFNLILLTTRENAAIFESLPKDVQIVQKDFCTGFIGKMQKLWMYRLKNIRYIFPNVGLGMPAWTKVKGIQWIPDFQYIHMPENFPAEELQKKSEVHKKTAESENMLVLSSKECLNDFKTHFLENQKKVYVMPFVSYIEPDIRSICGREQQILEKYQLTSGKYVLVSNQFWQHKNHLTVFKAIERLVEQDTEYPLQFVFTGMPDDYRDPQFYKSLIRYIDNPKIKRHIKVLGFLNRDEQLAIMKESAFIIQPSMFEGWGTVVEDAKVLDKTTILSDIPVHYEQMNDKCFLFPSQNYAILAKKIEEIRLCHKEDCIERGIEDMYIRAKEYSSAFEQLLRDDIGNSRGDNT